MTLGLALAHTNHTFSLLNQCSALPVEGEQRKVTQIKFLFFEGIFEILFLITQSLQVHGTILHVKPSGLKVLRLSKTKREENKKTIKETEGHH